MEITENCSAHTFERAAGLCGGCGSWFCAGCLVAPRGSKQPSFCVGCAIARAGVRSTAAQRTTKSAREIRRAARATARETARAEREGRDQPQLVTADGFVHQEQAAAPSRFRRLRASAG